MPRSKTKVSIPILLQSGAGLIVNVGRYPPNELEEIAREAAAGTCPLILRGLGRFGTDVLMRVAKEGKGRVIFDLT